MTHRMAPYFRDTVGRLLAAAVSFWLLTASSPATAQTGELVWQRQAHPTWIQDVVYSADGTRIATAGRQDHTARIWDAQTGERLLSVDGHRNNLTRVGFHPDGSLLSTVLTMISSGVYWLTSKRSFSSFSPAPAPSCED